MPRGHDGRQVVARKVVILPLLMLALSASRSTAAPRRPHEVTCSPAGGEAARVMDVTGDLELRLADGRTVLVAGQDPVRPTRDHPVLPDEARVKLAAWLVGRDVILLPLMAGVDRWNRTPALVFVPAGAGQPAAAPLSVSLALVDAGWARARPDPALHDCWAAIDAAETRARVAGLGLWRDPYYAMRDATDAAALAGVTGSMALVEGRVTHVGHGRSRLFIEIGGIASRVTLRLAQRDLFILDQLGLRENELIGARIAVRGFVDDRFGPSIDITDRDQVKVLERPAGAGARIDEGSRELRKDDAGHGGWGQP